MNGASHMQSKPTPDLVVGATLTLFGFRHDGNLWTFRAPTGQLTIDYRSESGAYRVQFHDGAGKFRDCGWFAGTSAKEIRELFAMVQFYMKRENALVLADDAQL